MGMMLQEIPRLRKVCDKDWHTPRAMRGYELYQAGDARRHQQERLERRIWRHFDLVIFPSEEDVETVRLMAAWNRSVVTYFCKTFEPDLFRLAIEPSCSLRGLHIRPMSMPPNFWCGRSRRSFGRKSDLSRSKRLYHLAFDTGARRRTARQIKVNWKPSKDAAAHSRSGCAPARG
jgi:hypothetical protein